MQEYNITSDEWHYKSDTNIERYYAGCAMDINSNFIFMFGGAEYVYYGMVNSIEEYNVNNNAWTVLSSPTLIEPIMFVKCILFSNIGSGIYCFGGYDDYYYINTYVHIFDPNNESFIDYSSYEMLVGRTSFGLVMYDNCLYVIGGWVDIWLTSKTNTDSIEYL